MPGTPEFPELAARKAALIDEASAHRSRALAHAIIVRSTVHPFIAAGHQVKEGLRIARLLTQFLGSDK